MSDPDLLLHLALDELQGVKLFDHTDAHRNGINHGAGIVEDDGFGPCLELKGTTDSYVELPSLKDVIGTSQPFTMMCWLKLGAFDKRICIAELELGGGERFRWGLTWNSSGELLVSCDAMKPQSGGGVDYRLADERIQGLATKWVHLTVVNKPSEIKAYLNGGSMGDYFHANMRHSPRTESDGVSYLGKSALSAPADHAYVFKGRIAQFRIYKRALTPEEISWDMESDRPVQYRYRITHPIDFSLENRDADPALFMDGHPDGQTMTLRVNNVTSGEVRLAPLSDGAPSETNCHFELAFRPGTLEVGSIGKVTIATPNSPWKIAGKTWTGPDDRDSLYLLCAQPGPLPAGGLVLDLGHMLPDARYGTRTTLVDFRYRNLKSGAGETISGSVQQNLDLVNHQGRRNIPLHVGFAGSSVVLNNADKPTTLRLRVANVLFGNDLYDDPRKASATGILRFDDKSEFLLSLDERPGTDWALNAPDRIREIVVRYARGPVTATSPTATQSGGTQGNPWQWTIPLKDLSLGPEEHLEIHLENVTAAGSDGHSNLYLDYRDIPGYWNGRFTTVIEKAPIVHRNGKVGIGVPAPTAELEVKGTLKVDSLVVTQRPAVHRFRLKDGWAEDLGQTPKYLRDTQGIVHLTGECLMQFAVGANMQQKKQYLERHLPVFELAPDCIPAMQPLVLKFPARVQFFGIDASAQSWHSLYLSVSEREARIYADALSDNMMQAVIGVRVFLDGISYLAMS